MMELKIGHRDFVGFDRILAVEYGKYVIALLNLSLIHCERQELTSGDFFFGNPFVKFFAVLL